MTKQTFFPNPLNTVAIQDKGGAVYNVMAYGAKGDGTTDDTTAIQSAITAAASGGIVFFPPGSYKLTAALTVSNPKVTLRGAGMKTSVLLSPVGTFNAVIVTSAADCAIEDLAIDGQYASQTNAGSQNNQCGVMLNSGSNRLSIRRCFIHDTCGHGVSNASGGTDLSVENCTITNGALAASSVQAVPAPTTTVFGVAPGTAKNFVAGQSLRIGSQTGTVSSVQSVTSYIASIASATVFTLNIGDGALFSNGQVIHIGGQTGTISSIATDTITLTSGITLNSMAVGQIVSIDTITLTGAITTPTAGQLVAVNVNVLKGIYCSGAASARASIRNNYLSGWSQAIGLWFGTIDCLVEGNRLIANYGFEDAAHTVNRSALEVYPNNAIGGRHRLIGNLIDGSTHNCIEWAQGEVGTICQGNILRNWAEEVGLVAASLDGNAIQVQGQAGFPGATTDIAIIGNQIMGTSAFMSKAINVDAPNTGRVKIEGNQISNLSILNSEGVDLSGTIDSTAIIGNTFNACFIGLFMESTAAAGLVTSNTFENIPINGYGVYLSGSGDAWIIQGNTINSPNIINTGILLSTGNRHHVIGNRGKVSGGPLVSAATNDNLIQSNILENSDAGNSAPICVTAGSRNRILDNTLLSSSSRLCVSLTGGDYTLVQRNTVSGPLNTIKDTSGGANNNIGGNIYATLSYSTAADTLVSGIVVKTSNYTILTTDGPNMVIANAAGLTITLPSAATANKNTVFIIKNGASGTGTLVGSTSGTIDGATAPITPSALTSAYGVMRFISDGTNWFTI